MHITVTTGDVTTEAAEVAIVLCAVGGAIPEPIDGSFSAADFTGKPNQALVAYPGGALRRVVLVGLGEADAITAESLRQAAATGIREARRFGAPSVTLGLLASPDQIGGSDLGEALAIGLELGAYRYLQHRTGLPDDETFTIGEVTVLVSGESLDAVRRGVETGQTIAAGVLLARDLVNTPPVHKTPPQLAQRAIELGERSPGITVTVLDEVQLADQGFGGIIAVGKASSSPPRFIIMEYGADLTDVPTICVVGKGITFDSGGLNIKPEEGMLHMKNDMGGSAAVLGIVQVVADLELPVHLVGLVPSAENMIAGNAYRPGDIVDTLSGKTIEILNTDAEGRVILSDALFYAQRYEPAAIVNLATLTGAVIVALGNFATGVMATDQPLADAILAASVSSGDRAWQLPLWDDYHEMVKGEVGDLKNLAGRPGGSITAGAFLAAFTGDYPFAHLDIAGTAWVDAPNKPYLSKGGTGSGVRLVVDYLRTLTA
jgi:leucyl aminopeptidase